MKKHSYEELEVLYVNLGRVVFEQDKMLDELISKKSLKLKKSSQRLFVENERKELFLRKMNLMGEFKEFCKTLES
jgi:hypothetical protein